MAIGHLWGGGVGGDRQASKKHVCGPSFRPVRGSYLNYLFFGSNTNYNLSFHLHIALFDTLPSFLLDGLCVWMVFPVPLYNVYSCKQPHNNLTFHTNICYGYILLYSWINNDNTKKCCF